MNRRQILYGKLGVLALIAVIVAPILATFLDFGFLFELNGWHRLYVFSPIVCACLVFGFRRGLVGVTLIEAAFFLTSIVFVLHFSLGYIFFHEIWGLDQLLSYAVIVFVSPLLVLPAKNGRKRCPDEPKKAKNGE